MQKEEIKEILDGLEKISTSTGISYSGDVTINNDDVKILKDYITNLQEENKQLKELCDKYEEEHNTKFNEWVFDKRENEMLKLEIERLNDVLVHKPDEKITLKTNDGQEMFIIQSERIDMQEELNKASMELMIKLEDYKSRNEKAIEYINNNSLYEETYDYNTDDEQELQYVSDETATNDLLNILQGVDKE